MKFGALVLVLGLSACHLPGGSCCSDTDCPGNFVCSTSCQDADSPRGNCLAPCAVDKDCASWEVCNLFSLSCGCQQIDAGEFTDLSGDAGVFGSCHGNLGN